MKKLGGTELQMIHLKRSQVEGVPGVHLATTIRPMFDHRVYISNFLVRPELCTFQEVRGDDIQ